MGSVTGRRLRLALVCACAVTFSLILILPPLWMVVTSLKPVRLTFALPPVWVFTPTLQHYTTVLHRPGFIRILSNTVIISLVSTAVTISVGSLAAYSMARFRTGGRRLLYATLVPRVLPPVVLGLPLFVLFQRVHLIDT